MRRPHRLRHEPFVIWQRGLASPFLQIGKAIVGRDDLLQGCKEALHPRVVVAFSSSTHALHGAVADQALAEQAAGVLAATVAVQSMSGTGKCYDNARMESFFATLKKEKIYRLRTEFLTIEQVKTIVFRYIFFYYNTRRVCSFNPGGWPPAVFASRNIQAA